MKIKGIITGDIVGSSRIDTEFRDQLLDDIRETVEKSAPDGQVFQIEFYRGDSFQIISDDLESIALLAILLRTKVKSSSPQPSSNWDVRLSIGVGEVSYVSDSIVTSDGEAFQLSGRGLDHIGKRRLAIDTRWTDVNEELEVSTAFLDALITDWSKAQSEVMYHNLRYSDKTQREIAELLETTDQNVSNLLKIAKSSLVDLYLRRFGSLIRKYQDQ